jgi:hypothetical protein
MKNFNPHLTVCETQRQKISFTVPNTIHLKRDDIKVLFREDGGDRNVFCAYHEKIFIPFSSIHAQISFVVNDEKIHSKLDEVSKACNSKIYVVEPLFKKRLPHITMAKCGPIVFSKDTLDLVNFLVKNALSGEQDLDDIEIKFVDFDWFGMNGNDLVITVEKSDKLKKINKILTDVVKSFYKKK